MPNIDSLYNEVNEVRENPEYTNKMNQFAENIKNELKDLTKDNYFDAKVSTNGINYAITIRYTNAKRGEWPNGIIQNDEGNMTLMVQSSDGETLDVMEFEALIMPRGTKINRKKGTLEQIEKYLVPKLKIAIQDTQKLNK